MPSNYRIAEHMPAFNIKPKDYTIDEKEIVNLLWNRQWHKHHKRYKEADLIKDILSDWIKMFDDKDGILWEWKPIMPKPEIEDGME